MKNKKGLFVAIWSDDDNAFKFNDRIEAIKQSEKDLKDINSVPIGTIVRIYDLIKIKPIREMKLDIINR